MTTTHRFDPVIVAETWELGGQTVGGVHPAADCVPPCTIHAPSDHTMRGFPLQFRSDRQLFERRCPHGVGHPDPDAIEFVRRHRGDDAASAVGLHGCDGCCR